jgi:hypothetical protein
MKSIILSVIAILATAVPSAIGAWWLLKSFGLSGATLAVTTSIVAMVCALVLYAGLIALGDKLGILKRRED